MICKKTRLNFLLSHTRISPPAKEVGGKGMKGRAIERRGEKKTRRVSRTRLHSFSAKSGMKRERESIKCTATSLPSARRRKGRKGGRRKISLKSTKISVARQVKDAVVHRAVNIKNAGALFCTVLLTNGPLPRSHAKPATMQGKRDDCGKSDQNAGIRGILRPPIEKPLHALFIPPLFPPGAPNICLVVK